VERERTKKKKQLPPESCKHEDKGSIPKKTVDPWNLAARRIRSGQKKTYPETLSDGCRGCGWRETGTQEVAWSWYLTYSQDGLGRGRGILKRHRDLATRAPPSSALSRGFFL